MGCTPAWSSLETRNRAKWSYMVMLTREVAFHKLKMGGDGTGFKALGEVVLWLLSLSEVFL